MKIATVLRSGGDYGVADVKWLRNQLPQDIEVLCFTDMGIHIAGVTVVPLSKDWSKCKGWWAKIELFRPDIKEDLLYFDLDTVITGDIREILAFRSRQIVMLTDFWRPANLMSSIMFIPHAAKAAVWSAFFRQPRYYINHCKKPDCWGDQGFLQLVLGNTSRWQDVFPDWFVSYKTHVVKYGESPWANKRHSIGDGSLPADARVVVFHGNPRPRQVNEPWLPGGAQRGTFDLPKVAVAL